MNDALEAKRRVYEQMIAAVEQMAAEDLKGRYGPKPPGEAGEAVGMEEPCAECGGAGCAACEESELPVEK